jgi:cell division initiation protein
MKITPRDIHNQEFKRSLRGYDMDEVDAFLQQIADELETLVSDNGRLKDQVKELTFRIEEYRKKDELLEKTLFAAQQATEQMKEASRKEVDAASKAARAEAAKIIEDARAELMITGQRVRDLKRYHYDFIIQYKALLDRHYRFLAEMVSEAKVEREKGTAVIAEQETDVKEPETLKAGAGPAESVTGFEREMAEGKAPAPEEPEAVSDLITVEIENLGEDANDLRSMGSPHVEVIGEPNGSFDAERAADEVFRRLGGEDEGEPIG